jgi:hypothetical protein
MVWLSAEHARDTLLSPQSQTCRTFRCRASAECPHVTLSARPHLPPAVRVAVMIGAMREWAGLTCCWSEDQGLLERSRARLLALAPALIVPGHGGPFAPGEL